MDPFDAFIAHWSASGGAERANKDLFLTELCDVLDVPRPNPTTGDAARDGYVFERDARLVHEGGITTIGKIDLFKRDCFILEAKQGSEAGALKLGTAKRGTPAWNIAMKDAYGQALGYARAFDTPVPVLIVADIGYCFDVYAAFDGSWNYRPFPNAQSNRLFLRDLPRHAETIRKLFLDPQALDPSRHAAKVTREIATYIANLAKKLESDGHAPELVATFLMRCLFTMFAEDVGLLPERSFTDVLEKTWIPHPDSFPGGVESLWRAMNEGGHLFGMVGKILRFNGGLFANPSALPLDGEALRLLAMAAECNWGDVEPAIFGTLLERALDPQERHRLGAHYTPRAYVERLVLPTIEEPLRAEWQIVQAQVRQLVIAAGEIETGEAPTLQEFAELGRADAQKKGRSRSAKKGAQTAKMNEAVALLRGFHQRLCATKVLDPACGSGNFLYVTLDVFKRLEGEVLASLEALGEKQELLSADAIRVTPAQFLGIEVKRWAKEIAELVLWIGYLQWHFRAYGQKLPVPEPILQDYKNIECRDAVLSYDAVELVRDEMGKPVSRWDGETMKIHPVTGEEVPDERATVQIYNYVNARKAAWPTADFIIGNPPFVGNKRMKRVLTLGYVDALRATYPDVPEAADYVMYWWQRAASLVEEQHARRFGLITTKSITQSFNRKVVETKIAGGKMGLAFAIPNHPWVDADGSADVRIAMTVGETPPGEGRVQTVERETPGPDDVIDVELAERRGIVFPDLTTGVNVRAVRPLKANRDLARTGMYPLGQGFILLPGQVDEATGRSKKERAILRPFFTARDLTRKDRHALAIDFYPRPQDECRTEFPHLFQWVLTRVKPGRDQDPVEERRTNWWLFTRPVPPLRAAVQGLDRFVLVPRTSKRFTFQFRPTVAVPDTSVVAIAVADAFVLGVLSSRIHQIWAVRSGGRLGVGDDPRYQHVSTFRPFPFADPPPELRGRIQQLAEDIDAHRKDRQREHPGLTITDMYNVMDKLRIGEALSPKEHNVHEQGTVSVLKGLHDELDEAVFEAYGWPVDLNDEQILAKLVALNAERAEEERKGLVRWLRPDFQNVDAPMTQVAMGADDEDGEPEAAMAEESSVSWPKKLPDQIAAVRDMLTRTSAEWSASDVASALKGAKEEDVVQVLDSLTALGLLVTYELVEGRRWRSTTFVSNRPPPS